MLAVTIAHTDAGTKEFLSTQAVSSSSTQADIQLMNSIVVELHKARDGDEAYAIRLKDEVQWRASTGYGSQFEKVWTVEFQGERLDNIECIDWNALVERTIEAYRMNDPVVTLH